MGCCTAERPFRKPARDEAALVEVGVKGLLRVAAALLLSGLLMPLASAQDASTEASQAAAFEAARKVEVHGPAQVAVVDQAVLKLPKGYVFVPKREGEQILKSMGNRAGDSLVGLVFPGSGENWFAVVRYINEGHITDDDAKEWNADGLLQSLKEGTEAANAERTKLGIAPLEVVGWAEPPRYDPLTHRLVWSATSRDKGTTTSEGLGVNYNTYALGREGYISLNLVTDLAALAQHKKFALELLGSLEYNQGRRYADFNSSTDKVAAYGLATLVAGAAAKKLGFFALLLAFMAKFSKVIIVAVGAVVWGVVKLLKRKRDVRAVTRAAHDAAVQQDIPPKV